MDDDLNHLKAQNYQNNITGDDEMIATANSVKDRVRRRAEAGGDDILPKQVRGTAVGRLNQYLGGNEMRKIVLSWLFSGDFEVITPRSSKTLSNAQMVAIVEWIDWWQDDDLVWHVGETFVHEAICVLNAALRAYNRANRVEKFKVAKESLDSVVASMIELGGVITHTGEQMDILSKIDKKGDENND
jgi:hypothetical protein